MSTNYLFLITLGGLGLVGFLLGMALSITIFTDKLEKKVVEVARRYQALEKKYHAALEIIEVKSRPKNVEKDVAKEFEEAARTFHGENDWAEK